MITIYRIAPGRGRWVIWSGGIYRAARRTCGRVGVNPERRLQMCAAGAPARLPFCFRHLLSSAFFPVVCLLRNVACRRPVARVSCCCWFASWRSVGTAGDQATCLRRGRSSQSCIFCVVYRTVVSLSGFRSTQYYSLERSCISVYYIINV